GDARSAGGLRPQQPLLRLDSGGRGVAGGAGLPPRAVARSRVADGTQQCRPRLHPGRRPGGRARIVRARRPRRRRLQQRHGQPGHAAVGSSVEGFPRRVRRRPEPALGGHAGAPGLDHEERRRAVTTATATMTPTSVWPSAPATLAEAGLSQEQVLQLLLKHLHFGADFTGQDLARRLGLEFTVIEPVLETLRFTHLCEVAGGSVVGGPSYRYRITDEGRRRALLFLEQSQYVGAAPVPLQQYRDYLHAHGRAMTTAPSRARVREAFSHLVLN